MYCFLLFCSVLYCLLQFGIVWYYSKLFVVVWYCFVLFRIGFVLFASILFSLILLLLVGFLVVLVFRKSEGPVFSEVSSKRVMATDWPSPVTNHARPFLTLFWIHILLIIFIRFLALSNLLYFEGILNLLFHYLSNHYQLSFFQLIE